MAKPDVLQNLARKMSSDPAIQRQIAEAFFQLTTSNPQLGRRLLAGDPQAVLEAYQTLIRNNGNIPMPSGPPRIGASPIGPGQTVGGVSGPGVPVNPGTGMIPAPPRGLPNDPSATRQLTTTGGDAPDALDSAAREITVIDATPRTGLIPADAGALVPSGGRGPGVRVGGLGGPPTRYGTRGVPAVADAPPPSGGLPAWAVPAAAAAYGTAVGIGAYNSVNRDGPVADDLEAAATEIAPDEEVGDTPGPRTWRDMSDEEMVANLPQGDVPGGGVGVRRGDLDAYGRRYRQAIHNTIDRGVEARQAARAAGATDLPAESTPAMGASFTRDASGLPNFAPGATVTVDGVQVPGYDLGDGRLRYRLGDVKAAHEAERDARWLAGHRAMVDGDIAKYGHYSIPDGSDGLTVAQAQNRKRRARAEANQYAQVQRQRAVQIANRNRELTPYESEQKARRDRVAARAMLAGGSQNINPQNAAAINALVELEGVDPNSMDAQQRNLMYAAPGGQGVAAVDAAGAQNAMRMIQPLLTAGAGGTLGLFGQRDPAMLRDMQRMDALRLAAGQAYTGATYASSRRRAVNDALIRAGASAAERARLMEEYFGSEPPADVPAPPPLGDVDAGMMPQMSL